MFDIEKGKTCVFDIEKRPHSLEECSLLICGTRSLLAQMSV